MIYHIYIHMHIILYENKNMCVRSREYWISRLTYNLKKYLFLNTDKLNMKVYFLLKKSKLS
jgi:hypothetical protein